MQYGNSKYTTAQTIVSAGSYPNNLEYLKLNSCTNKVGSEQNMWVFDCKAHIRKDKENNCFKFDMIFAVASIP